MAEHVICVTANGGIPLLTRTKAGCSPLPFPVIGSLYGVHMFGLNRDVSLLSTFTEENWVVWKLYQDSIVLIAIAPTPDRNKNKENENNLEKASRNTTSTVSDLHLLRLLDNVFHSLVLLTGLDEVTKSQNINRLKRDLRSCYKLIDSFLDPAQVDKSIDLFSTFGDITQSADIIIHSEAKLLLEHLDAFVEAADSTYGCLCMGGNVVCATDKWWMLTGQEMGLIGRLIRILPSSRTSSDIPIYLPHSSPNIPHRLLVFTLLSGAGLRACVLCGPQPSLSQVQDKFIQSFWGPGISTLQKCQQSGNIPQHIRQSLPADLLGLLLVDTAGSKCVSQICPTYKEVGTPGRRKQKKNEDKFTKQWIYGKLARFYKMTVGTSILVPKDPDNPLTESDDVIPETIHAELQGHTCLSHYRCLKKYKCFAIVRSQYQLFVIYSNNVPTFAMENLTEKTFNLLLKDGLM